MAIVSLDNESAFTLHVLHKKGIVISGRPGVNPAK